jgi:predicted nucleic acid-binding protein
MRIYLDMCCFNRPYDDQAQSRIHLETEAKLLLQQKVRSNECDLVWSSVLDLECNNNPFDERRLAILQWRRLAVATVMASVEAVAQAKMLQSHGIAAFDALHVACAIAGQAHVFVTTDDRLIKKMRKFDMLPTLLPGDAIAFVENWYEN